MYIFFSPHIDKQYLDENESHHCAKVLRLKTGQIVYITDGKGTYCKAKLTAVSLKKCDFEIIEKLADVSKRSFHLHLGIAPTKSIRRIEWLVAKCTEIGIDEITPIICHNSERRILNIERLKKIALTAMKQSKQAFLPVINPLITFDAFLKKDFDNQKYIAHCRQKKLTMLASCYKKGGNVTILIGPEGDFSKEEIAKALHRNYQPVSLSENILRTETAGIVVCQIIHMLNLE